MLQSRTGLQTGYGKADYNRIGPGKKRIGESFIGKVILELSFKR